MTEYNGGSTKADHLCVLVHGLWGQPAHLASVAAALRDAYSEDELHILVAESNSGYFTYDGIETGGERVCFEIEDALAAVRARGGRIAKLSVVGYSLGGLVARYAVGLLHARGVLDGLACHNFVAFASPFLGVRQPTRGAFSALFNALGPRTISMSGRQLFGVDVFRDTGRPLLAVMADPSSIFAAGLRRFRRRTLYANVVHDRSAVYYTTAIAATDPYAAIIAAGGALEDLPATFAPGYADVVMDRDAPVTAGELRQALRRVRARKASADDGRAARTRADGRRRGSRDRNDALPDPGSVHVSVGRALRNFLRRPWNADARAALFEAAPVVALALLLPLGVTWFLANSVYQTVQSSRRRQLHEGGLAGIDIAGYRVPLWMKGLQDTVEEAFEDSAPDQKPAYAPAPESASASASDDASEADSIQQGPDDHSPVLALTPDQFKMIAGLDSLGWRKYRVWIHNVKHSHAAIIVRYETPRFAEGRVVLNHFVREEFVM